MTMATRVVCSTTVAWPHILPDKILWHYPTLQCIKKISTTTTMTTTTTAVCLINVGRSTRLSAARPKIAERSTRVLVDSFSVLTCINQTLFACPGTISWLCGAASCNQDYCRETSFVFPEFSFDLPEKKICEHNISSEGPFYGQWIQETAPSKKSKVCRCIIVCYCFSGFLRQGTIFSSALYSGSLVWPYPSLDWWAGQTTCTTTRCWNASGIAPIAQVTPSSSPPASSSCQYLSYLSPTSTFLSSKISICFPWLKALHFFPAPKRGPVWQVTSGK